MLKLYLLALLPLALKFVNAEEENYEEGQFMEIEKKEDDYISWNFTVQRYYGSHVNYGNLVANNGTDDGLVCINGMSNQTADYLCEQAGYTKAIFWTRRGDVGTNRRLYFWIAANMGFHLDEVVCTGKNRTFDQDCSFDTSPKCSVNDALVLQCVYVAEEELAEAEEIDEYEEAEEEQEEPDVDLDGQFSLVSGKGNYWNGNSSSTATGNILVNVNGSTAMVCLSESYATSIFGYLCRQNGFFPSTTSSITHRKTGNGVDCDWATSAGLTTVTMDLRKCDTDAVESSECTWGSPVLTGTTCNIDDTIVVSCT